MWTPFDGGDNLLSLSRPKIEIISITSLVETKNSSDLSSGRRPNSKSDEFFVSTKEVIERYEASTRKGAQCETAPRDLVKAIGQKNR